MTPQDGNSYPTLSVMWDEAKFGLTIAQCARQLSDGEPRIEVLTDSNPSGVLARLPRNPNRHRRSHPNPLQIISMTLQPGEDLIVGNRLRQVLNKARKQSA
jgi:L-seryl-tRNA(Ser) seleniumtransferase